MAAKIQKWGNSLGVRIPKTVVEKMKLSENSEVEIEHKDGTIVIFPTKTKFLINDLISQINEENLHREDDFIAEGKEVWS